MLLIRTACAAIFACALLVAGAKVLADYSPASAASFSRTGIYQAPPNSPIEADALGRKIEALIGWIERNSDYTDIKAPPVLFVTSGELKYVVSFPNPAFMANDVLALYVDGIVFLPDNFQLGRHDYMLLHELVHHAQKESGREYGCVAEREAEAYALQIRFVDETGRGIKPGALFLATLLCDFY